LASRPVDRSSALARAQAKSPPHHAAGFFCYLRSVPALDSKDFASKCQKVPALNAGGTQYTDPAQILIGDQMAGYKDPDFKDRQKAATAARKAALEKHRAAAADPAAAEKQAARVAVIEARQLRAAEREKAKKLRAAEKAKEAAQAAEAAKLVEQQKRESEAIAAAQEAEREEALQAEQKAARDARYAARKAAKKVRRRGY
jgi:hypothetical protein